MRTLAACACLPDQRLKADLRDAAAVERDATVDLIALIAEYDRRRLCFEDGFTSTFAYCVKHLHLAESSAYARIQAARAARRRPDILEGLADGSLTLTNVVMLAPHLKDDSGKVLEQARHKSKADVERLVATISPQPDVPSIVRKLPQPVSSQTAASPSATIGLVPASDGSLRMDLPACANPLVAGLKPAVVAPLSPERYKLQVTIDEDTRDVLRQAQDLMRHTLPTGDPAVIVARALRLLVEDLLKKKAAATQHPRPARPLAGDSRTIPATVKREVWLRDHGRCTFEGVRGRCNERSPLEYHHVIPYALGGQATVDNIELRCAAHNAYQARLDGLGWQPDDLHPRSSG